MGPYPYALAAALVAGLLAGLALGTVRLTRLSLGWWRALRARLRGESRAAAGDDAGPRDAPQGPPGPFPRAHGAVAGATLIAVGALLVALRLETVPAPPVAAPAATWSGVLLGFGLLACVATVAAALLAAGCDRAVQRLARPLVRRADATDLELSFADLRAGAVGLWGVDRPRGEPFGVGLGYVSLFASPAAALALVLCAPAARPDPSVVIAFAAAFLVVPLAYAAAAERSQREEAARLRRRAAVRQLLVAPLWLLALLALADGATPGARMAALAALALVLPFALPGASPREALLSIHRGGDLPEASPSVRAITGLAHHAWIGAWAVLVAALLVPASAPLAVRGAIAAAALLGLVVARAALILALQGPRPAGVPA